MFEAGGQRWGMDMGSDNYGLKNYFSQSLRFRYGYYRKSTAGHNTLTFDNDGLDNSNRGACDQDPGASGITAISLFAGSSTTYSHHHEGEGEGEGDAVVGGSSSSPAYSIVDLTAAYGPQNSSRIERGFAFTESYEHLLIVDEFEFVAVDSTPPRNVTWTMHTMATIQLPTAASGALGGSAVLSLGGATLYATVIEPAGAAFSAAAVDLDPPQNPSVGVSKLKIHLNLAAATTDVGAVSRRVMAPVTRLVVGLSLSAVATAVTPNPLSQWKAVGPFAGEL